MSDYADLSPLVEKHLARVVELRHTLHSWPELGFEETRTANAIAEILRELPAMETFTGVGGTGVVGLLGRDKPGPCVALRADIDALPIQEENSVDYASQRPGYMHACGHDGHTAALMGAALVLHEIADELEGPVKFLFQPAEELGSGAERMTADGALENPRPAAVFGFHGWPVLAAGKVGLRPGPLMGSATNVKLTINAAGGHAAMPHQTPDPVLIAAHLTTALQEITARHLDPLDAAVVSITRMRAGESSNVIPSSATLHGTIRALSDEVNERVINRIRQIASGLGQAFGVDIQTEIGDTLPVTENHAGLIDYLRRVTGQTWPDEPVGVECEPTLGAEDFGYYNTQAPAAFWFLGLLPPDQEHMPQLHQPQFNFPDEQLPRAITMHCESARRFAREHATL